MGRWGSICEGEGDWRGQLLLRAGGQGAGGAHVKGGGRGRTRKGERNCSGDSTVEQ